MTNSNSNKKAVSILYTNYRGKTAIRQVIPKNICFEKTDWHPDEQWILEAFDLEKNANRGFTMKDIKAWFLDR